uniref:Histone deacetylase 14 n=1 Tax=Mesocestoides corti TaxID=53468 RepID=A0A5K3EMG7_MESCO
MDLTDYYIHAFPPKHPPSNVRPAPAKGSADAGKKKPEKWPEMMSPDILNALFG